MDFSIKNHRHERTPPPKKKKKAVCSGFSDYQLQPPVSQLMEPGDYVEISASNTSKYSKDRKMGNLKAGMAENKSREGQNDL